MLPGLSIVLGGIGSGKTVVAENLVKSTGRNPVCIVTAPPDNPDMNPSLSGHTEGWKTHREPLEIGRALAGISGDTAVLLDAVPTFLANQAAAGHNLTEAEAELMAGLALCAAPVVVITREPDMTEACDLRAALGALNLKLSTKADLVVNVIAGLPQVLKGSLP